MEIDERIRKETKGTRSRRPGTPPGTTRGPPDPRDQPARPPEATQLVSTRGTERAPPGVAAPRAYSRGRAPRRAARWKARAPSEQGARARYARRGRVESKRGRGAGKRGDGVAYLRKRAGRRGGGGGAAAGGAGSGRAARWWRRGLCVPAWGLYAGAVGGFGKDGVAWRGVGWPFWLRVTARIHMVRRQGQPAESGPCSTAHARVGSGRVGLVTRCPGSGRGEERAASAGI
jgi:hypothetical protein